ncbi:MAG: hypothetical protein JWQ66_560 [Mucilaginibacter sp.]|nr:hypothetical protein [Mucilaginibacter sp.]
MIDPLAKTIIEFHEAGYEFDFVWQENDLFVCLQTNREFSIEAAIFRLTSQVKDRFSNSIKYLYCVEAPTGIRGVLLADELLFRNANSSES